MEKTTNWEPIENPKQKEELTEGEKLNEKFSEKSQTFLTVLSTMIGMGL